jgi:hypothetical protein
MAHRTSDVEFLGKSYHIEHRVIASQQAFDALWAAVQTHVEKLETVASQRGTGVPARVRQRIKSLEAQVAQYKKIVGRGR